MKRVFSKTFMVACIGFVGLLLLPGLASAAGNDDEVSGNWIGTYTLPDLEVAEEDYRIKLILKKDNEVKAIVGKGPEGFMIKDGVYDPETNTLTGEGEVKGRGKKASETFSVSMDAEIEGDTLSGTFVADGMVGTFVGLRQ
jgi:hypothetical protein